MKKINIFLLMLFSILALSSCSDTEDPKIGATINAPVLQQLLPQNLVISEETNLTEGIGNWVWNAADYGVPTQITYAIEADTAGGAFEEPITLTSTTSLFAPINAGMLNSAASKFITETSVVTLDIRLKTTVSPGIDPVYSNIEPVTFTAFIAVKTPVYIIGNALIGWDNSPSSIGNNLQVFFSDDSNAGNSKYTYTGYFNAGSDNGFKIITIAGDWGTAYAYQNGSISPNNVGDNFAAPATSGIYTLNVDLEALTYTLNPYAKTIVSYDKIGLIGDGAKGWGDTDDIVMTKFAEHVWVINSVALKAGSVKFRIVKADGNGDWGTNWGGESATPSLPFGIGKSGGENFPIEKPGTYFVAFNDLTGHYIIIDKTKLP